MPYPELAHSIDSIVNKTSTLDLSSEPQFADIIQCISQLNEKNKQIYDKMNDDSIVFESDIDEVETYLDKLAYLQKHSHQDYNAVILNDIIKSANSIINTVRDISSSDEEITYVKARKASPHHSKARTRNPIPPTSMMASDPFSKFNHLADKLLIILEDMPKEKSGSLQKLKSVVIECKEEALKIPVNENIASEKADSYYNKLTSAIMETLLTAPRKTKNPIYGKIKQLQSEELSTALFSGMFAKKPEKPKSKSTALQGNTKGIMVSRLKGRARTK